MGYGTDEAWEHEDEPGKDRPYTDHEIMLAYFGIDQQEWNQLSGNDKANHKWNFRNLGKEFKAKFLKR